MFQFDLYSCSDFTPTQVLDHINEWFELNEAYWSFIDRNQDVFYEMEHGVWENKTQ
jgi:hypothetical protein